jgi:hypothetical protein
MWPCVQASSKTRSAMRVSWYFSMSAVTAARDSATPVTRSTCAVSFGCSRMTRRIQTTGSSTGPWESDKPAPLSMAAGEARVLPLPTKRIRSVSNDGSPTVVPRTVIKCTSHGGRSSAERARRVQKMTSRFLTSSVWMNRLLKAGWDRSWSCGAKTTSA